MQGETARVLVNLENGGVFIKPYDFPCQVLFPHRNLFKKGQTAQVGADGCT
jgi:hypothetical protein